MNKGFTLVELLAVIIILAMIMVITSTSITKVVNDSKTKLSESQEKLIKQAVKNYYLENMEYIPEEGACSYVTLGDLNRYGYLSSNIIDPENNEEIKEDIIAKVTKENNKLIYDVNNYNIDGCKYARVCRLVSGAHNEIGSRYSCEVKEGSKHTFYVLSHEEDGTTNLIMERNINKDGTLATKSTRQYDKESTYNISAWYYEEDNNKYGPITILEFLKDATSDWNNVNIIKMDSFDYYNSNGELTETKPMKEYTLYARVPYYNEVANYDGSNGYLYNYLASYNNIQTNSISGITGYWTLSAATEYENDAWAVYYSGTLFAYHHVYDEMFGIRPVINIDL